MSDATFGMALGALAVAAIWALVRLLRARNDNPDTAAEGVRKGPPEARLEELEDKYNRLERRFTRLQGEFNAVTRLEVDEEPLPEDS